MRSNTNHIFLLLLLTGIYNLVLAQYPTQRDHERKVDSFLTIINSSREDTGMVNTLNALSEEHFWWSEEERPKAYEFARKALLLAEKFNYKKGEAQAYVLLAQIYAFDKKDMAEGLRLYNKLMQIWEELNNKKEVINTNIGIAWVYNYYKDTIQALMYLNKAIKISEQVGDKAMLGSCYSRLAMFYTEHLKYQDAIKNYLIGLKISDEANNKETLTEISNNISLIYWNIGNYPEALKHLLNVKKYSGHEPPLTNLTGLYIQMGYYNEALNLLNKRIESHLKENNKQAYSGSLRQIGNVYISMADNFMQKKFNPDSINYLLKKAQDNYELANYIQAEAGLKTKNIQSTRREGNLYLLQAKVMRLLNVIPDSIHKKLDLSLNNFLEALRYYQKSGEEQTFPGLYTQIAEINFERGNLMRGNDAIAHFEKAILFADSGLVVAKELGLKASTRDAYNVLSKINTKTSNYKKALEYQNLFSEVNEELLNIEATKTFEQLKLLNETEQAAADERVRYEKLIGDINLSFSKREDSIRYQQKLIALELEQKSLLTKQQEQDLLLKQQALSLLSKENEINHLAFLKSQADFAVEQSQRLEKEKELTIANQEKFLQSTQLNLQKIQLDLKENQIQAERKQRLFYLGGIILLLLLFVFIYRNIKNRQRTEELVAAERLKSEKANAAHRMAELELQSLRAQLNPHFMFNSLNAIQELILKEDNDNSHLYLSRFSELLRILLDNANQPFVSLRKELNLLELYLSLENLRIPDLKYSLEIDPSIDSNRITIPNMMLQPYLENAIWHGLSHKKEGKKVSIRISKNESGIVFEVEDNGVGRKMATELKSLYRKEHRSRGMELLSKRFSLLSKEYGSDIHTKVEDLHDNGTATGTRVAITVPYSLTEQPQPVYS